MQAAGLKSAPSPPEPNVVCPNGPKELYECCAEAGVAVIGGGTALLETEQGSP